MPNNNLPSMSVLSEMITRTMRDKGIDEQRVFSLLNDEGSTKSLNWQILYK